jgi:maleylacetate reductase
MDVVFSGQFEAQSAAVRVRFGPGLRHQIAEEIDRLGCTAGAGPVDAAAGRQRDGDGGQTSMGKAAGVFTRLPCTRPVDVTAEAIGARSL